MDTLLLVSLAGGLIGAGALSALRALTVRAPSLARIAADLQRPVAAEASDGPRVERCVHRIAPWLVTRLGDGRRARDLRVAGRTAAQHAVAKVSVAGALAALPLVATTTMSVFGVPLSPLAGTLPALALATLGWMVPDLEVRDRAAGRREEFVAALSAYLDVVAILLAGGAGTETALYAAAEQGDGWAFRELRGALDHSRFAGVAPWASMEQLGRRLGIDELVELAASASVAGRHGAQVRESLTARAAGMRASQLARVEERAGTTTEKMTVPLAILGVSFLGFIIFPAVMQVLAVSQ